MQKAWPIFSVWYSVAHVYMDADSLKPSGSLLVSGWNCSAESVEGCRLHDHIEKVLLFGFDSTWKYKYFNFELYSLYYIWSCSENIYKINATPVTISFATWIMMYLCMPHIYWWPGWLKDARSKNVRLRSRGEMCINIGFSFQ